MKDYRKIILLYSSDKKEKKNKFIKEYNTFKKDFNKRDVKLIVKKDNKRSELFNISLYGYDGKLKYVSNKISSLSLIIKKIDKMPIEMMKKNVKSIELYTNSHPNTTIKGTGFKNEATAKKSLKLVKNKPIYYQFLVINTLYQRAKYHPHQTTGIRKAMKIFHVWIKKYNNKKIVKREKNKKSVKREKRIIKGGSQKFPYLSLELVNKFEKLADYYNISRKARGLEKPTTSDEGFLVVYRRVKGDAKKMELIPCRKNKPNGVNWRRKREVEVSGKLGQAKRMKLDLFHKEGKLKGLPTKIHTNMIMWAFSPESNKLKKSITLLKNLK